jgi:protein-S-isoprenylcysteine O-methyltransferase Ste14
MFVIKWTLLVFGTAGFVWVSRGALRDVRSHGFYRFFAWELMLILLLHNINFWFIDPFSFRQIMSWIALFLSLPLVILGVRMFMRKGKIDREREAPDLLGIEKTTELVTSGIYHYIRHPFYSSLLFLAWGIFLKHISWPSTLLVAAVTVFLTLTAKREEVENIEFFGEEYRVYMQNTKMFIPYIL